MPFRLSLEGFKKDLRLTAANFEGVLLGSHGSTDSPARGA